MSKSNLAKTIVVILLLLIVYPLGLIAMWLIAPWSKGLKIFLTIFFLLPFLLIFLLFAVSSYRIKKQIKEPLKGDYKIFQDTEYPISFKYPANWVITIEKPGQDVLEIMQRDNRFLSTAVKKVKLTDLPFPKEHSGKSPLCIFSINIHRNPERLSLKEWYKKEQEEGYSSAEPKSEEEKKFREMVLRTVDTTINSRQALRTAVTKDYILGRDDFILVIKPSKMFQCSKADQVVLDSLKIK